jgi:hypothetical protein
MIASMRSRSRARPYAATLPTSQQVGIERTGIDYHPTGDVAAGTALGIEGTPFHVLSQVVRAELVFWDAEFLHPQSAVFVEPVNPTAGEILSVVGGVCERFLGHGPILAQTEGKRNRRRFAINQ